MVGYQSLQTDIWLKPSSRCSCNNRRKYAAINIFVYINVNFYQSIYRFKHVTFLPICMVLGFWDLFPSLKSSYSSKHERCLQKLKYAYKHRKMDIIHNLHGQLQMHLLCGDFLNLFYLFDLARKFISHLLPSLGLSHVIFSKAGQYKSLIYRAILSNLFRLHKKPVASEKQQELLICF